MSKNDDSIEEVSKTSLPNNTERFHKKLTDVSLYSVAGLCAVSLLRVSWEDVEELEGDLSETLEYQTYIMSEYVSGGSGGEGVGGGTR
ncbi:hypothetical protein MAR_004912 [Mya arenaria]|uniref:Uncharacterized protein n=1 Tax=Mya arenaria TaxID=6604 RepID=A0ABY7EZM5_MYAAR|nr:hypothetical protein MAR_004912 [Mya arenaria]